MILKDFNANDVVVCEAPDGQRWTTDWMVYYGKQATVGNGLLKISTVNCSVSITINGSMVSDCYMQVEEDGYCMFPDGYRQPSRLALQCMDLIPGMNAVSYEVK